MPNTLSTKAFRDKYRLATLDTLLRSALVAEKICQVDNSDVKTIQNPYGSQPSVTVQAIAGTYSVGTYTTTDDTLTVTDEVIYAEQVYDFEQSLTNFDMFQDRTDEQAYAVARAIDQYVINVLTKNAGTTYSTAVGGFATAANVNGIMGALGGLVAGYADTYKGMFLVIENTDVAGFVVAMATNGFSFADAALNNGWMNSYMGIDIYVVRSSTFVTATIGTQTFTNSGHRLFGVKNVCTYASPRGIQFEEKGVSGKTGKEVVTYGYIGAKVWATKAPLIVNITLN